MERLSKIFRVRFKPSTISTIRHVSRQTGYKPSTIVRMCVQSAFDPRDARSRMAVKMFSQAANKRQ